MTPPDTLIDSIKQYMLTYSALKEGAPVWVDYLGQDPTQYAVIPLPGARVLERYLDGGSKCTYPFAFQSMESTADELERLESAGFYEKFAKWLDSQTEADAFPELASGLDPERIEALGWGYLYQQGESTTGMYQIQCQLIYYTQ